nr:MAG TPA: hypothetical protein [Caudoviricetes sp.]
MRVISQDGTTDFPYDNAWVSVYEGCINRRIYVRAQLCGYDDSVDVADYSTKEKARKAMEMLREAYISMPIVMQNVDVSEDVAKEFERLKKCGVIVRAENQQSKVDFISNAFFQFPQDDEIEV